MNDQSPPPIIPTDYWNQQNFWTGHASDGGYPTTTAYINRNAWRENVVTSLQPIDGAMRALLGNTVWSGLAQVVFNASLIGDAYIDYQLGQIPFTEGSISRYTLSDISRFSEINRTRGGAGYFLENIAQFTNQFNSIDRAETAVSGASFFTNIQRTPEGTIINRSIHSISNRPDPYEFRLVSYGDSWGNHRTTGGTAGAFNTFLKEYVRLGNSGDVAFGGFSDFEARHATHGSIGQNLLLHNMYNGTADFGMDQSNAARQFARAELTDIQHGIVDANGQLTRGLFDINGQQVFVIREDAALIRDTLQYGNSSGADEFVQTQILLDENLRGLVPSDHQNRLIPPDAIVAIIGQDGQLIFNQRELESRIISTRFLEGTDIPAKIVSGNAFDDQVRYIVQGDGEIGRTYVGTASVSATAISPDIIERLPHMYLTESGVDLVQSNMLTKRGGIGSGHYTDSTNLTDIRVRVKAGNYRHDPVEYSAATAGAREDFFQGRKIQGMFERIGAQITRMQERAKNPPQNRSPEYLQARLIETHVTTRAGLNPETGRYQIHNTGDFMAASEERSMIMSRLRANIDEMEFATQTLGLNPETDIRPIMSTNTDPPTIVGYEFTPEGLSKLNDVPLVTLIEEHVANNVTVNGNGEISVNPAAFEAVMAGEATVHNSIIESYEALYPAQTQSDTPTASILTELAANPIPPSETPPPLPRIEPESTLPRTTYFDPDRAAAADNFRTRARQTITNEHITNAVNQVRQISPAGLMQAADLGLGIANTLGHLRQASYDGLDAGEVVGAFAPLVLTQAGSRVLTTQVTRLMGEKAAGAVVGGVVGAAFIGFDAYQTHALSDNLTYSQGNYAAAQHAQGQFYIRTAAGGSAAVLGVLAACAAIPGPGWVVAGAGLALNVAGMVGGDMYQNQQRDNGWYVGPSDLDVIGAMIQNRDLSSPYNAYIAFGIPPMSETITISHNGETVQVPTERLLAQQKMAEMMMETERQQLLPYPFPEGRHPHNDQSFDNTALLDHTTFNETLANYQRLLTLQQETGRLTPEEEAEFISAAFDLRGHMMAEYNAATETLRDAPELGREAASEAWLNARQNLYSVDSTIHAYQYQHTVELYELGAQMFHGQLMRGETKPLVQSDLSPLPYGITQTDLDNLNHQCPDIDQFLRTVRANPMAMTGFMEAYAGNEQAFLAMIDQLSPTQLAGLAGSPHFAQSFAIGPEGTSSGHITPIIRAELLDALTQSATSILESGADPPSLHNPDLSTGGDLLSAIATHYAFAAESGQLAPVLSPEQEQTFTTLLTHTYPDTKDLILALDTNPMLSQAYAELIMDTPEAFNQLLESLPDDQFALLASNRTFISHLTANQRDELLTASLIRSSDVDSLSAQTSLSQEKYSVTVDLLDAITQNISVQTVLGENPPSTEIISHLSEAALLEIAGELPLTPEYVHSLSNNPTLCHALSEAGIITFSTQPDGSLTVQPTELTEEEILARLTLADGTLSSTEYRNISDDAKERDAFAHYLVETYGANLTEEAAATLEHDIAWAMAHNNDGRFWFSGMSNAEELQNGISEIATLLESAGVTVENTQGSLILPAAPQNNGGRQL